MSSRNLWLGPPYVLEGVQQNSLADPVCQGACLFKRFHSHAPELVQRIKCNRVIPPAVVQLGELKGIIYSSDRWSPGRKQTFIHFMEKPPRLVSDPHGTQLYIIGGRYRVTSKGIEG